MRRIVKLTFLGTKGALKIATRAHRMHTSLLVAHGRGRVRIDCGEDWLGRTDAGRPRAIVLTHAHRDHALGLREGAPCPVWATAETWRRIDAFPIPKRLRRLIRPRTPARIDGLLFEAFPLEHSVLTPAVGYRISAGRRAIFYAPDVLGIADRAEALAGVDLYVGDAARLTRPKLKIERGTLRGHAPARAQLGWCAEAGVRRAIFTHCGKEIVAAPAREVARAVRELGEARGVQARLARDGMTVVLR